MFARRSCPENLAHSPTLVGMIAMIGPGVAGSVTPASCNLSLT